MSWRRCLAGFVTISLLGASPSAAQDPGAFELLEQIRQAYAGLESYGDLGEIESTVQSGDSEQTSLRFFEISMTAAGTFLWRTQGDTEAGFEDRVVWTDGETSQAYSSLFRQVKPVSSVAAEMVHGFGRGGYETLLVPLLLAGAADALGEPSGAAVEGVRACGEGSCWVVFLSRMGGTIESELLVDQKNLMIREVTVRLDSDTDRSEPSHPGTGPDARAAVPGAEGALTLRVRHYPGQVRAAQFQPPAGAQRVAEWHPPETAVAESDPDPWPDMGFEEEITVALWTIVARIVDSKGEPIADLEPADLIARVGGTEVPVVSLDWSSSYQPIADIQASDLLEAHAMARTGALTMAEQPETPTDKLVVLFVQADFAPSRVAGHLKILPDVERLLRSQHPRDQVAIVSFDSHLKLWLDFTRDREAAFQTLKRAIRFGSPAARRSREVSLVDHFDFRAAADAASPERALELTARAMAALPGEKDLIYLGWGLGRYGAGGVRMTSDYEPAVRALDAARATVFVLDVSQADYHSLEIGLQNVAAHTGGTYARTFHFASQAVDRLARTIGGHYLVTFDRSTLPDTRGRLAIRLRDNRGRVLFKPLTLG